MITAYNKSSTTVVKSQNNTIFNFVENKLNEHSNSVSSKTNAQLTLHYRYPQVPVLGQQTPFQSHPIHCLFLCFSWQTVHHQELSEHVPEHLFPVPGLV